MELTQKKCLWGDTDGTNPCAEHGAIFLKDDPMHNRPRLALTWVWPRRAQRSKLNKQHVIGTTNEKQHTNNKTKQTTKQPHINNKHNSTLKTNRQTSKHRSINTKLNNSTNNEQQANQHKN